MGLESDHVKRESEGEIRNDCKQTIYLQVNHATRAMIVLIHSMSCSCPSGHRIVR